MRMVTIIIVMLINVPMLGASIACSAQLVRYAPTVQYRAVTPAAILQRSGVQVVTDIDDTIKSSGGVTLAGIPLGGVDTAFSRGSFYPGVFAFAIALSKHGLRGKRTPARVAVLTARAREFMWALEIKQSDALCRRFQAAGEDAGAPGWGIGPVLYGSVSEWVCQERKGWRKFENFKLLKEASQDTHLRYVFVGDNGYSEKDLEAAQRIIEEFPRALKCVFIHAVSGESQPAELPEVGVDVVTAELSAPLLTCPGSRIDGAGCFEWRSSYMLFPYVFNGSFESSEAWIIKQHSCIEGTRCS